MRTRIRRALDDFAVDPQAHANQVTKMVGSQALRIRIADFRATQAALASAAGISQAYLAQMETGRRVGAVRLYTRLAKLLRLQMEDLVPDDE